MRRTPLQPKTGLTTRTRLARRARLTPGRPTTPRRPRRELDEQTGRALVEARSGGLCEIAMCGGRPATDWSHRVRRSQQGSWSPANGLHACRACHGRITTHPWQCDAERNGWALRSTTDPASTPCLYRGRWVLLTHDGQTIDPPTTDRNP